MKKCLIIIVLIVCTSLLGWAQDKKFITVIETSLSGNHEAEDCLLLRQAAEKYGIPQVSHLAEVRENKVLDAGNAYLLSTIQALAEYARQHYGEQSLEFIICQRYVAQIYNTIDLTKSIELISDVEASINSFCKRNPKMQDALILKMSIQLEHLLLLKQHDPDNPEHWKKLLDIEKEVEPYLKKKDLATSDLVDVCFFIAYLKQYATYYADYVNYEASQLFPKGQLSVEAYLQKANDMSCLLWAENNLYRIKMEIDYLGMQSRFHTADYETIHQRLCDIQAFLTDYLPAGDIALVDIELLIWDCDISFGQRLHEIRSPYSLLFKVSAFYGSDSEEYFNYLYRMAQQQGQVDLTRANRLVKELLPLAGKLYKDLPDVHAQSLVGLFPLMQATAQIDAESYDNYMKQLVSMYEEHHHASWGSVFVGISLADIIASPLQLTDKGIAVYQTTLEDVRQITSDNNLLYGSSIDHYLSYLRNSKDTTTLETGIAQCEEAISLYKKYGLVNGRAYQFMSEMQANLHQYAASIQTLKAGIDACSKKEDRMLRCIMQMLLGYTLYSHYEQGITDEVKRLFEEAIPYYLNNISQCEDANLNGFVLAGDYYRMSHQYDKAEETLRQGLEQYETLFSSFDYTYMDLISQLYELYAYELNDMDQAEKLLEGKLEAIRQDPSYSLHSLILELLWKRYYLISGKNGNDWILRGAVLKEILKELQTMGILSSGENEQLKEIALPFLYELVSFCTTMCNLERELENETVPDHEEAKVLYTATKNTTSMFKKICKEELLPIMLETEQSYRQQGEQNLNHSDIYQLYNALANYYTTIEGDTVKAKSYYQQLQQSPLPTIRFMSTLQVATIELQQEHFAQAADLFERIEQMEKQMSVTMTNLSSRVSYYQKCCFAYYRSGRYQQALRVARDIYQLRQQQVNQNFDLLTETERNAFLQSGGAGGDGIHLLLPHFPEELSEEGYDATLAEKGILLRASGRIRNAILKSGDKQLLAQMDSLNRLNQIYKQMDIATLDQQGQFTATKEEVIKTRQKIEELERSINRQAAKFIGQVSTPDWKQLQAVLKPGEAAVEYVLSDSIVGMLVLLPEGRPHYVPLTATVSLWKEVAEQNKQPQQKAIDQLYGEDCLRLYDRLWKPMESLLSDVRCVYYSPTAFLNSLSFAAFKCDDGQYLMDKYELHQMLSTGNLVEVRQRDTNQKVTSAMLLGAVFYSPDQQEEQDQEQNERGAVADEFSFLPFTQTEVTNVEQVMKLHHVKTSMMTGFQPTEQNVRQQNGQSADILHLSTHGFFVDTDKKVLENRFLTRFPSTRFSSMQRSGLALVGANQTWEGDTGQSEDADGILTANEVATLDLSHTRLAVLSACQTAVGRYDKEGVYGMHRGFKQAGVKSILATLWNVNDKSTAHLMEMFYRKWLSGGNMQQSLTESIRELRKEYPSPFYWAPFVLMDAEN